MHTYVHRYIYIYIYRYMHIHTHVHIYMCVCIYIQISMPYPEFSWTYRRIQLMRTSVKLKKAIIAGTCANFFFTIWSIQIGLKFTSRYGLTSFWKPCSKNFGMIIWAPIPIQQQKHMSCCPLQLRQLKSFRERSTSETLKH